MADKIYYTKSHEWCAIEGDIATIGITEHAQTQLGDIVFVELPESDSEVLQGDDVAVVESVKTAADIYAPVGGKVVEVNTALTDNPGLINSSPETEGWIYRCSVAEMNDNLLTAEAYQELVAAE